MSTPVRHTAIYFNLNAEKKQKSAISGQPLSKLKNPVYFRGNPNIYDLEEVHKQWNEYAFRPDDMYPVRTYTNGAAQYDQTMDLIARSLSEKPMKMYVGNLYEIVSVSWDAFVLAHENKVFTRKMFKRLHDSNVNIGGCELPPSILASASDHAPDLESNLKNYETFLKEIKNWDHFNPITPEKRHFFLNNMHITHWRFEDIHILNGGKTLNFGIDNYLAHELYDSELKHAVFTYGITWALKVPVTLIQINPFN
jgi:hypothetical protein